MPDEVPISRDITDIPVVTSGLDRPENKDLKAAFDAWEPEPVKEEEPPSAPVEKPEEELVEAKETEGETRTAHKPEVDVQEAPAEELPRAKRSFEKEVSRAPSEGEIREITDPKPKLDAESFEAMELRPDAPETQKSQFRQLKEVTQKFSAEAKAYRAKLAPLIKEFGLGDLPENPADVEKTLEQFQTKLRERPAVDPAVAQELETYRILTRNSEVQKSLTFDRDFVRPVQNAFSDLVTDLASSIPSNDPNSMKQWAQQVLANVPELITAEWLEEHLGQVRDGLARERIRSKAGNLSGLIQNKTRVKTELVANGDLYHQWQRDVEAKAQKQYDDQYRNDFQTMVMDESTKLLAEPEFEEIRLLREAAKRGDNAELAKESQRLEDAFRDHLTKINTGPRAQTKIIMRNLLLERKLENYKALEAENIRLKKETQSRNRLRGHELQPHRGTAAGKSAPDKPKLSQAKQPDWDSL
jgi:hypothetical protein